MKKLGWFVAGVLLVSVLGMDSTCKAADPGNEEAVVKGNTEFALDLYGKLKDQEGNLFLSPFSISTALAMTYAGARGNTEKQMAEVLHFSSAGDALHAGFADLDAQLNAVQKKGDVELSVANALWAQKGHPFLPQFLALAQKYYGAGINQVDFETAVEAARKEINQWVEQKTKDKIKELIRQGVLDARTRLVLTNAIYFKGNWEKAFRESSTHTEPFTTGRGQPVDAAMMTQKDDFGYMETDALQMLELPYKGGDLSMIVLLPKEKDGLSRLEAALKMEDLTAWMGRLHPQSVLVYLPKFKMTAQFELARVLASMGMGDAFGMGADFSGMDGKKDLYISAVIHKAFVDVNEKGTEAAAATAVVMRAKGLAMRTVFRADHPFMFLIRENASGSVLFMGRVVEPGSDGG